MGKPPQGDLLCGFSMLLAIGTIPTWDNKTQAALVIIALSEGDLHTTLYTYTHIINREQKCFIGNERSPQWGRGRWIENFVLPRMVYVCISVSVFTECSPVNSMNGLPVLNKTVLHKLEMVIAVSREKVSGLSHACTY